MSFLSFFKTIKMQDIKLKVSKTRITFSYEFGEKDEKALNLAAGRIHRKATAGSGQWKLEGIKLSVVYSNITEEEIPFKDIAELFEEMVK